MKNKAKEVKLELEMPGFERKDIRVKISRAAAEIIAEKKHEKKIQKKGFFHHEKSYRSFSYYTTLPKINPKKAKTEFKKGILKIAIAKDISTLPFRCLLLSSKGANLVN